jgi:cell shape-determining protein MreD
MGAAIDPSLFAKVYGLLAFVFAAKAFFIYKISTGRNWARIIYSIVIVLGMYKVLPDTVSWINEMSAPGLLSLVAVALQVVAIFLLFTPPSNQQFRKPAQVF